MKLSIIFEPKPEQFGLRGDPYFWDYLKEKAEDMDCFSLEELESWIKYEYGSLAGQPMTGEPTDMVYVEQFSHGGMSAGCLYGKWWSETGIPLLKSRLQKSSI